MLFQYHTGSMTRRVRPIEQVASEPYVEIHREDAKKLGIEQGSRVRVSSRRGTITLTAQVSNRPEQGVVFIPFHYKEAAANVLTSSTAVDPVCKIPELKVTAVKIERV
jgi:predicted molibdopterin-dependent oxidoreductase YjgC